MSRCVHLGPIVPARFSSGRDWGRSCDACPTTMEVPGVVRGAVECVACRAQPGSPYQPTEEELPIPAVPFLPPSSFAPSRPGSPTSSNGKPRLSFSDLAALKRR